MTLRNRVIISVILAILLIGVAILIWAYQTGRISIWGDWWSQEEKDPIIQVSVVGGDFIYTETRVTFKKDSAVSKSYHNVSGLGFSTCYMPNELNSLLSDLENAGFYSADPGGYPMPGPGGITITVNYNGQKKSVAHQTYDQFPGNLGAVVKTIFTWPDVHRNRTLSNGICTEQVSDKPNAPTNLTAQAISTTEIKLNWTASAGNGGGGCSGIWWSEKAGKKFSADLKQKLAHICPDDQATFDGLVKITGDSTSAKNYVIEKGGTLRLHGGDIYILSLDIQYLEGFAELDSVNHIAGNYTLFPTSTNTISKAYAATPTIGYNIYDATNDSIIDRVVDTNYNFITGVCNTPYSFYVKAYDSTNIESDSSNTASVTTLSCETTDTESPTAPTNVRMDTMIGEGDVLLTWDASTDNVGVAYYQVYAKDADNNSYLMGSTSELFYLISGGAGCNFIFQGCRSFYVVAVDAAGNHSPEAPVGSGEAISGGICPSCVAPDGNGGTGGGTGGGGTSGTTLSGISKLISTGQALWFNILVALLVAGIISWFILRKR